MSKLSWQLLSSQTQEAKPPRWPTADHRCTRKHIKKEEPAGWAQPHLLAYRIIDNGGCLICYIFAAAAAAKSLQSCPTLCNPIDGSPPGSPVPGILQARTLEWVVISFSNAVKWKVKVKSLSRDRLLATPWTAAYQAPPSMGFSRQEYWSGVPLPYTCCIFGGDLFHSRFWLWHTLVARLFSSLIDWLSLRLCQSFCRRPRNLSTQWDSTALLLSPVLSTVKPPCSLHNWQLRIFILKSLTLQSLGVRFIPTFGSNFRPNHKVSPIHWDSCFYFLSFHSQASRGKCLSLPKPPAACRAEWDSPNSFSVFPLDPSILGLPKPGVQLMLEIP